MNQVHMDFSTTGILICCHLTLQMCDLWTQGLASLSTSLPVCTQAQRLTMGTQGGEKGQAGPE